MAIAPERPRIYDTTRVPDPIPSVLEVPPHLRGADDVLRVNFGPNHPSTHGVLRVDGWLGPKLTRRTSSAPRRCGGTSSTEGIGSGTRVVS